MFLPDFNVMTPESLDEALALLDRHGPDGAMILAGGTDLLVNIKENACRPHLVIALDKIEDMDAIEPRDGMIRIGAKTTFDQIMRSDLLKNCAPVLVAAASRVGSPQLRNRGTIGGNIGNASPCADSLPALAVLEAEVNLASKGGERRLPIIECFRGPKETCFRANEIISHIEFPVPLEPDNSFYLEKGQRNALSITKLSVAGQLELGDDGAVRLARIAYGAVAPTVIRGTEVEAFLEGKALNEKTLIEAATLAETEVKPIDDIRSTTEYRRELIGVLLKRGLRKIAENYA